MQPFEVTWELFKDFVVDRNLSIQWIDINDHYHLYALDGGFRLNCMLHKSGPDTASVADFEDNFKDNGNRSLSREQFDSYVGEDLNSEFVYDNWYGFSTIGFHITPPNGGTISFQGSFDGDNFFSINFRGIESNLFISHTSIEENIIGSIAGLKKIKFITTAAGSSPGHVKGRVQSQQAILEGIENSTEALSAGGVEGAITVGSSPVEVRVGASNFEGRKLVTLFNNSNTTWYWGYRNTVSTSTGTPLLKTQLAYWQASADVRIWVVAATNGHNGRVTEGA